MSAKAYCQRFWSWKKGDKSQLQFAGDLCAHFDHWYSAAEGVSHAAVSDLIILEQFLSARAYSNIMTVGGAASLTDYYVLAHGGAGSIAHGDSGHRDSS